MSETCITFGEFGARVMIEDEEVEHYAVQVDPVKKEVSCWIASEAGKQFSVIWLDLDVDFPTSGDLYLDGCRNECIGRLDDDGPIAFEEALISDSSGAPYLFSPLVITDDDAFLDSSSSSIGEIKLIINRITTPVFTTQKPVYNAQPELKKVHERSKKAIAHRVDYGKEYTIPELEQATCYDTELLEILVTFIFKYRPLAMLQANGIAPRNPEPLESQDDTSEPLTPSDISLGKRKPSEVKKESESEEESEDVEEKREEALLAEVQGYLDEVQRCQTEIQRCQAEIQSIKNARRSKSKMNKGRPKKKVKKEKKAIFLPGELIDLT